MNFLKNYFRLTVSFFLLQIHDKWSNWILLAILMLFASNSFAQNSTLNANMVLGRASVIQTIQSFFDGMRKGDTFIMEKSMSPDAILNSVHISSSGETVKVTGSSDEFIVALGGKKPADLWDEKIWSYDVTIDGALATVVTPYTFYLNKELSHCGINLFQLYKKEGKWLIFAITDTRRKTNCITSDNDPKAELSKLVDEWHAAAAKTDMRYFEMMTEDAIYIGTDASERWTKAEFMKFAVPYFEKGTAWDFKTIKRDIYLSSDRNLAWFEESLDTWMGECRASGVLRKENTDWKIAHYHLSVTVPNDLIKQFIELVKNGPNGE